MTDPTDAEVNAVLEEYETMPERNLSSWAREQVRLYWQRKRHQARVKLCVHIAVSLIMAALWLYVIQEITTLLQ